MKMKMVFDLLTKLYYDEACKMIRESRKYIVVLQKCGAVQEN